MKNIVIFGGGTGLSHILGGLKLFPLNVSAIIGVSDNGSSTGILKEEMNVPAIGDIGKVLISMANVNNDMSELLKYRFKKNTSIDNHPIRNILLVALYELKGNLNDAIEVMCKMLNIKGNILPVSEDKLELIGIAYDNTKIYGEEAITSSNKKIKGIRYNRKVSVNKKVLESIKNADLIIFSPGSLFTSILPHLIIPEVRKAISISKAKKLYITNLFTQPGETDNFSVSDHLKVLNKYVKLDAVIANDGVMPKSMVSKYETLEQKDPVLIDEDKINKLNIKLIKDSIYSLNEDVIRHDSIKTAYLIFSYLINEVK